MLSVTFSPDGRTLVGRSWDKTIRLWNTETGQLDNVLVGHTDDVDVVVFSPDGSKIASGSQDDTVRVWDANNGELQRTLVGHWAYLISLAFSPDGSILASGSEDDVVQVVGYDFRAAVGLFVRSPGWSRERGFSSEWRDTGKRQS